VQKSMGIASKICFGAVLAAVCGIAYADVIVNDAFTAASPITTQTGRITRNGVPSTCGVPKVYPGTFDAVAHRFNAYTFQNNGPASCVTVTLSTTDPVCSSNIFAVAYTPSFNPASIATNYLADTGSATGTPTVGFSLPMSFFAPANSPVVVDVVESGGAGTCTYTVQVSNLATGPVPTMSQWGLLLLALLLGAAGFVVFRRRYR